jgi:hypothetical protein
MSNNTHRAARFTRRTVFVVCLIFLFISSMPVSRIVGQDRVEPIRRDERLRV